MVLFVTDLFSGYSQKIALSDFKALIRDRNLYPGYHDGEKGYCINGKGNTKQAIFLTVTLHTKG